MSAFCQLLFVVSLALGQHCDKDGGCITKTYPELVGLDQEDPILIEAIKKKVLIPPSTKPLNMLYKEDKGSTYK